MCKYIFKLWVIMFFLSLIQIKAQHIPLQTNQVSSVVANSDFVSMGEGATEVINVLNNDYGLLSGVKELNIIESPEHATLSVENFKVIFTPDQGFIGIEEFKYSVCNNDGDCDEAEVTVIVEDVDFNPTTNNDYYTIEQGEEPKLDVLINDKGLYDLPLSLAVVEDLENGYSVVENDLMISVQFNNDFVGKDSLKYEVCDLEGDCSQAWLVIDVIGSVSNSIFIPQGISPNGDGFNDVFNIPDLNGETMKILIFNSQGTIVFKSDKYNNNWDGSSNVSGTDGLILDNGNYYYVLKVIEKKKEYTGVIYISK